MVSVVGVHGISQEQRSRPQLVEEWGPALHGGVEIAGGRAAVVPSFDLAFYGDLFLSTEGQGAPVWKSGGVSPLDRFEGLSAQEVAFLNEAAEEIEVDERRAPKGFVRVPDVLVPMTRRLCRRFDGWTVLAFVSALRQVRLYLEDDDLAEQVRGRVVDVVASGCRVMVGHSLGSVVAFETLALNPGLSADVLLTAGSPLSMRTVSSRLRVTPEGAGSGLPARVNRWVNVYDRRDPVAGAGPVNRLWDPAEDFEVNNGNEPHSIARYMSKRIVGEVILG